MSCNPNPPATPAPTTEERRIECGVCGTDMGHDYKAERDALARELEEAKAALNELHGSYESLRAAVRPLNSDLAESAYVWDGPICFRSFWLAHHPEEGD